ncbi:unnamed protein product [Acanthoscelides obtectus]|uniref:Uncharacterized protein n=1 Tax=Acanthoscelides obtectus TaxID=200917 RepID=A0A9P0NZM8_ACAOB|nr:unnamed protein product [Acanthoscelides obtectus]CAK1663691.1 hypothetical protein AOBTE_LOCUS23801 [Acanthoscelides obtectus]
MAHYQRPRSSYLRLVETDQSLDSTELDKQIEKLVGRGNSKYKEPSKLFAAPVEVPQIRRSVVARALQNIYSSTPVAPKHKPEIFTDGVSPITSFNGTDGDDKSDKVDKNKPPSNLTKKHSGEVASTSKCYPEHSADGALNCSNQENAHTHISQNARQYCNPEDDAVPLPPPRTKKKQTVLQQQNVENKLLHSIETRSKRRSNSQEKSKLFKELHMDDGNKPTEAELADLQSLKANIRKLIEENGETTQDSSSSQDHKSKIENEGRSIKDSVIEDADTEPTGVDCGKKTKRASLRKSMPRSKSDHKPSTDNKVGSDQKRISGCEKNCEAKRNVKRGIQNEPPGGPEETLQMKKSERKDSGRTEDLVPSKGGSHMRSEQNEDQHVSTKRGRQKGDDSITKKKRGRPFQTIRSTPTKTSLMGEGSKIISPNRVDISYQAISKRYEVSTKIYDSLDCGTSQRIASENGIAKRKRGRPPKRTVQEGSVNSLIHEGVTNLEEEKSAHVQVKELENKATTETPETNECSEQLRDSSRKKQVRNSYMQINENVEQGKYLEIGKEIPATPNEINVSVCVHKKNIEMEEPGRVTSPKNAVEAVTPTKSLLILNKDTPRIRKSVTFADSLSNLDENEIVAEPQNEDPIAESPKTNLFPARDHPRPDDVDQNQQNQVEIHEKDDQIKKDLQTRQRTIDSDLELESEPKRMKEDPRCCGYDLSLISKNKHQKKYISEESGSEFESRHKKKRGDDKKNKIKIMYVTTSSESSDSEEDFIECRPLSKKGEKNRKFNKRSFFSESDEESESYVSSLSEQRVIKHKHSKIKSKRDVLHHEERKGKYRISGSDSKFDDRKRRKPKHKRKHDDKEALKCRKDQRNRWFGRHYGCHLSDSDRENYKRSRRTENKELYHRDDAKSKRTTKRMHKADESDSSESEEVVRKMNKNHSIYDESRLLVQHHERDNDTSSGDEAVQATPIVKPKELVDAGTSPLNFENLNGNLATRQSINEGNEIGTVPEKRVDLEEGGILSKTYVPQKEKKKENLLRLVDMLANKSSSKNSRSTQRNRSKTSSNRLTSGGFTSLKRLSLGQFKGKKLAPEEGADRRNVSSLAGSDETICTESSSNSFSSIDSYLLRKYYRSTDEKSARDDAHCRSSPRLFETPDQQDKNQFFWDEGGISFSSDDEDTLVETPDGHWRGEDLPTAPENLSLGVTLKMGFPFRKEVGMLPSSTTADCGSSADSDQSWLKSDKKISLTPVKPPSVKRKAAQKASKVYQKKELLIERQELKSPKSPLKAVRNEQVQETQQRPSTSRSQRTDATVDSQKRRSVLNSDREELQSPRTRSKSQNEPVEKNRQRSRTSNDGRQNEGNVSLNRIGDISEREARIAQLDAALYAESPRVETVQDGGSGGIGRKETVSLLVDEGAQTSSKRRTDGCSKTPVGGMQTDSAERIDEASCSKSGKHLPASRRLDFATNENQRESAAKQSYVLPAIVESDIDAVNGANSGGSETVRFSETNAGCSAGNTTKRGRGRNRKAPQMNSKRSVGISGGSIIPDEPFETTVFRRSCRERRPPKTSLDHLILLVSSKRDLKAINKDIPKECLHLDLTTVANRESKMFSGTNRTTRMIGGGRQPSLQRTLTGNNNSTASQRTTRQHPADSTLQDDGGKRSEKSGQTQRTSNTISDEEHVAPIQDSTCDSGMVDNGTMSVTTGEPSTSTGVTCKTSNPLQTGATNYSNRIRSGSIARDSNISTLNEPNPSSVYFDTQAVEYESTDSKNKHLLVGPSMVMRNMNHVLIKPGGEKLYSRSNKTDLVS